MIICILYGIQDLKIMLSFDFNPILVFRLEFLIVEFVTFSAYAKDTLQSCV